MFGIFLFRKNNPHDVVFLTQRGPRMHHFGYIVAEAQNLFRACDVAGNIGFGDMIERASADVWLRPGDLIGSGTVGTGCLLEVRDETGETLGSIAAVHDFGAGDILEVRPASGKSLMIPFTRSEVRSLSSCAKATMRGRNCRDAGNSVLIPWLIRTRCTRSVFTYSS